MDGGWGGWLKTHKGLAAMLGNDTQRAAPGPDGKAARGTVRERLPHSRPASVSGSRCRCARGGRQGGRVNASEVKVDAVHSEHRDGPTERVELLVALSAALLEHDVLRGVGLLLHSKAHRRPWDLGAAHNGPGGRPHEEHVIHSHFRPHLRSDDAIDHQDVACRDLVLLAVDGNRCERAGALFSGVLRRRRCSYRPMAGDRRSLVLHNRNHAGRARLGATRPEVVHFQRCGLEDADASCLRLLATPRHITRRRQGHEPG
mmetsp:Transcript_14546/g.54904  ORF Transcript_14546/g.54904 Transcript_14546/m.54904 type:complete len:259 (+) Transcript_14546:29-805(+)